MYVYFCVCMCMSVYAWIFCAWYFWIDSLTKNRMECCSFAGVSLSDLLLLLCSNGSRLIAVYLVAAYNFIGFLSTLKNLFLFFNKSNRRKKKRFFFFKRFFFCFIEIWLNSFSCVSIHLFPTIIYLSIFFCSLTVILCAILEG